MAADLLLYNALVLTLEPGATPIAEGFVAVKGGKISAVGPAAAVRELPPARQAWIWRALWCSPVW